MLALPQIVVDVDSDGSPSVGGFDAKTLSQWTFGQLDLSGLRIDPEIVNWFTKAGLQHIVLIHKDDGLYILANNRPLPHVAWDRESLQATSTLASDTGLLQPEVARVLRIAIPFLQRIGINVALRFPVGSGGDVIEIADANEILRSMEAAGDEAPMAVVRVHVNYDTEGVPSVLQVSTTDLEEAFGADLRSAQLSEDTIATMMDAGIQHLMVRTTDEGMLMFVNGQPLPHVAWSEDYLQNGAELYSQLYFTDEYEISRQVAGTFLPLLNNLDGEVVLLFPVPAGAEKIDLPNP